MSEPYAQIHHFDYDPATGAPTLDEDGEPLVGFYFELFSNDGRAICGLTGPYKNKAEVEAAAKREFSRGQNR